MKKTISGIIVILLVAALSPGLLAREADGTQKGRFYLEIKGGQDQSLGGGLRDDKILQAAYPHTGTMTYFYGTEAQKNLSYLAYSTAPEPRMYATYGEFVFEYTVANWFGVGFDFHNSQYTIKNAKSKFIPDVFETGWALFFMLSNQSPFFRDNVILLETLQPIMRRKIQVFNIATTDFNATFHILSHKMVDPYFRFFIGVGRENYSRKAVIRLGTSFGLRLYMSHMYLLAEVSGAGNLLQVSGSSGSNGDSGGDVWKDISEGYAQMGLGVTL